MKKVFLFLLAASLTFFTIIFSVSAFSVRKEYLYKVAMVTGYADVDDNSFNQQTYEGCKEWCNKNGIPFSYFKPASNSDVERLKSTELAIERGYNVLFLPGYNFAPIIAQMSSRYSDVTFIGIDIAPSDFPSDYTPTENIFCFSYHEEQAGYLAGYAAVKEGYRKHGFLGGMEAEVVTRFGYGYAQGMNDAAVELGLTEKMDLNFVYSGQFYGDNDITKYMDNWYKTGTEIVFACGGSIYTSAALAAKDNGGKVIGVDVDQSIIMDKDYGKGICLTSAMKGIAATCKMSLELMSQGVWEEGSFARLGLISSTDLESNYVGLPIDTWSMNNFTIDEYKVVVDEIINGTRAIDPSTDKVPSYEHVNIRLLGNIK